MLTQPAMTVVFVLEEKITLGSIIANGIEIIDNIVPDTDSFDDLEDFTMDEEEEMIPTVTVPDGTDLSAVSGTDEDSSEE